MSFCKKLIIIDVFNAGDRSKSSVIIYKIYMCRIRSYLLFNSCELSNKFAPIPTRDPTTPNFSIINKLYIAVNKQNTTFVNNILIFSNNLSLACNIMGF
jgi:hypothetical protein